MHDDNLWRKPPKVLVGVTFAGLARAFADSAIEVIAISPTAMIQRDNCSVGAELPLVCAVAHTAGTDA